MRTQRRVKAIGLLLGTCCGVLAQPALADSILIVNPSFEISNPSIPAQLLGEDAFTSQVVPGWTDAFADSTCGSCFGIFNPGPSNADFPGGSVPDGNNAAYVFGGGSNIPLTQTLATTLEPGQYSLTVAVGNPKVRTGLKYEIILGLLGSSDDIITIGPTDNSSITGGTFLDVSQTVTVAADNPDIGKTLEIELFGANDIGAGSAYTAFDNVSLNGPSSVPEPRTKATMLLASLALLGWRYRRWRNTA